METGKDEAKSFAGTYENFCMRLGGITFDITAASAFTSARHEQLKRCLGRLSIIQSALSSSLSPRE